ncbi:hypothetical protein [Pedobacter duraquae]|uniref:Uncharacterized protein n=1 Tax=Pedobacter duraquae TaxID=425511 RepID=A0A4R6IBM6_9SPHI|nr:hypothetical protein [Pedobacter duraquae]TDO19342.1 hypothetical protein CLV32_4582 [Pedobacter duraquae]
MIITTFILLLFQLANVFFPIAKPQKQLLIVIKTSISAPGGKTIKDYFPPDSIFIESNYGIEPLIRTSDIEMNGSISTSSDVNQYYLINFAKQTFQSTNSLTRPFSKPEKFSQKKLGLDIAFKYRDNEKFKLENILISGKAARKVSYVSELPNFKGFTIIFTLISKSRYSYPSLFPNIESEFGGVVQKIEIIPANKQGTIIRDVFVKPTEDKRIANFFLRAIQQK